MRTLVAIIVLAACVLAALQLATLQAEESKMEKTATIPPADSKLQQATFGSGCFWCTEAVFQQIRGVHSVQSGYSGGSVKNPDYKLISTGTTDHAEVVQMTFDPAVVTYPELLEVFWKSHDPTTLNRQGNDVGTQYRSVVFYHSDEQWKQAEDFKKKLDASDAFERPIVTEISPITEFYPAEDYHQDYFALHGREPYCQMVVRPKVEKVREVFRDKLKEEAKR